MNKDALTAVEVADILKVAQNTVYELVKRGQLNCYKVGRKMRFTYEDVQEYISSSKNTARPVSQDPKHTDRVWSARNPVYGNPQNPYAESVGTGNLAVFQQDPSLFRICGQDDILDILAKYMSINMADLHVDRVQRGSYDSLVSLYKDHVMVAACHMWDAKTDSYNTPYVEKMLPGCPAVVIRLARRMEGFFVAEGNPKGISSWEDLKRPDIVLANREPGAGTRILLDEQLRRIGMEGAAIKGYGNLYLSHMAVAGSVSKGDADIGVGLEKVAANTRGVSFVPLITECYDLAVKKQNMNDPRIQLLIHILNSEKFQEEFRYLNGYDVSEMGRVIAET